jgi:polyphosphate kinase 2 (PPK2 family)
MIIVKLFFHVTREVQDQRLRARLDHAWKRWKVTEEDLRNRGRREEYLAAIKDMLEATDTRWAPWRVIDGNDKKAARIAALSRVAEELSAALPAEPPPLRPEMEQLAQSLLRKRD